MFIRPSLVDLPAVDTDVDVRTSEVGVPLAPPNVFLGPHCVIICSLLV